MVTRRNRNFKEKSTAANILSRLVMPVAVIMALALFYFSIKLFFFSSPREEARPLPGASDPPSAAKPYEANDGGGDELPPVDMDDAAALTPGSQPLEHEDEAARPQPPAPAAKPKPKPAPKPAKPAAKADGNASKPARPAASGPRWDGQIGGCSARSGADLTAKQANSKGYSAYVVSETLDGKPFYKVRVRGHADKNETRTLSKKLADAGFPVYLVSVK